MKRKPDFSPKWVFEIWAGGAADSQCAGYDDLPVSKACRLFWRVRGEIVCFLFGWWWVNWEVE